MTAIPSASWSASSRYWVQSRIVVPPAESARMMSQTWLRERGARRRLVEEQQLGRHHKARRDVEPAAHAARVVLYEPVGGLLEAERFEQFRCAGLRVGARQPEQPAQQHEVFAPAEVLVDRGHLARQADQAPNGVALGGDVVSHDERGALVRG
jgi:hypothetical protein